MSKQVIGPGGQCGRCGHRGQWRGLAVAVSLAGGMSGTGAALAQDSYTVSGNVAVTSDYRFRGISQTDRSIALQGGLDLVTAAGWYAGVWGSSVDFDDEGSLGSLELDYYLGWSGDLGNSGVGLDAGYMYYDYPGDDGDTEGDYQELYIGASWRALSLQLAYSDDYYAGSDEFWYLAADYSWNPMEQLTIGLHAGYNMLEQHGGFLSSDQDAYTDYAVSASYGWSGIDFTLAWVGTDLDDDDVFGTDWADDSVVFSIARSL